MLRLGLGWRKEVFLGGHFIFGMLGMSVKSLCHFEHLISTMYSVYVIFVESEGGQAPGYATHILYVGRIGI